MEDIVADISHLVFDIEKALDQQLGAQPLPFPGMDKSGAALCTFFLKSTCSKGANCPFRHVQGEKSVVCKHWLRGLCKKGDFCEFLHEYDMLKMPECYFYSRFGECGNKECPFLHIDPEQKIKVCPWYDRGFCRHGASCKNRHVRRVICVNYMCGFCLDGPLCKYVHPRFDIPYDAGSAMNRKPMLYTCHFCGESGHKAASCPKLPAPGQHTGGQPPGASNNITIPLEDSSVIRPRMPGMGGNFGPGLRMPRAPRVPRQDLRPLEEVTCFKCGEKGHYANKCPKGHLAFLTHTAQNFQQQQQLQSTGAAAVSGVIAIKQQQQQGPGLSNSVPTINTNGT